MSRREPLPTMYAGETAEALRSRAATTLDGLAAAYPDSRCHLHYDTPWQLLVATILSAQCTDARVNQVTPILFARCPDAAATAAIELSELEAMIRSTGFFHAKARNIQAAAVRVLDEFDGELPQTVAEITTLPGAARKTANVVIGECFPANTEGVAVDTHVQRITRRLGWVTTWAPTDIEQELTHIVERRWWPQLTHLVISHGRAICTARKPDCLNCPVAPLCPSRYRFATSAAMSDDQVAPS